MEFFGYVCSHNKEYKLSKARKDSVTSLPFPRNQKEVQQVMGTANMFPVHSISLRQVLDNLLSCNKCKLMCYSRWESEGTQPYLVDTYSLDDQYMVESRNMFTVQPA